MKTEDASSPHQAQLVVATRCTTASSRASERRRCPRSRRRWPASASTASSSTAAAAKRALPGGSSRTSTSSRRRWSAISTIRPLAGRRRRRSSIVAPDETLERAAQLMTEHSTAHLIVVDPQRQRPIGVLSTLDIAASLGEDERAHETAPDTTVFDRVVCGVDDSDAGVDGGKSRRPGHRSRRLAHARRRERHLDRRPRRLEHGAGAGRARGRGAERARARPRRGRAPPCRSRRSSWKATRCSCLLAEIARRDATAVVVGSHGVSRATGIALGAVSTYLLHEAPCSVLIARGSVDVERWPQRIVVGVDGSARLGSAARGRGGARRPGSAPICARSSPLRMRDVDLDAARADRAGMRGARRTSPRRPRGSPRRPPT